MLYPVALHKDPDSNYGVSVPDLPGCISAGENPEEALMMVKEAIELHIEGMLEDGEHVPPASRIEKFLQTNDYRDCTWALVDINIEKLMGPSERINITVPRRALRRIDAAAQRNGMNRSQYLVSAALAAPEVPAPL